MQANVQRQSLKRFLLIRLATDRHTRPKRNGPRGSLFGPSARDGRRAEGQSLAGYLAASCGFTGPALVELGVCGRERGSQLERSNAKHHGGTRTHDPDQAALATKTADRNRHDPAERTLVCPTLVQTTTLPF